MFKVWGQTIDGDEFMGYTAPDSMCAYMCRGLSLETISGKQQLLEVTYHVTPKGIKSINYLHIINKMNENMNKNKIRLTESKLKQIVAESVKKVLREGENDYDPYYEELIKKEMHNLWDLSEKVPRTYRAEIYYMGNSLQAILQDIKRRYEFDNWNN